MKIDLTSDEAAVLNEHLAVFRDKVRSFVKESIAQNKSEHDAHEALRQYQHDLKRTVAAHLGDDRARQIFDELENRTEVAATIAEVEAHYPH